MRLHYTQASPFARKVRLAAAAAGLAERIELVQASLSPIAEDAAVCAANPLGKVPTLVLDDGTVLYDSRVIVAYFDAVGSARLLPPPPDPAHWRVLRIEATADGLLDAALSARYERLLRPEPYRWDEWSAAQSRKIDRALAALEGEGGYVADGPPLAAIAVVSALGYLDFRFPERDWRATCPQLAALFGRYAARPDMAITDPGLA